MKAEIEKIVFGGAGIARTLEKTLFVRKSVSGDILEVEIFKDKKSFAECYVKKIIQPSKMRIEPKCKYFEKCGGCEHQNIEYTNQLKIKNDIINELLERGKISTEILPIIAGSDPLQYRNSIRFAFLNHSDGKISFSRHNFIDDDKLIEADFCLLVSGNCNMILKILKDFINKNIKDKTAFWQIKIREGKLTNEIMLEIITLTDILPNEKSIVEILKKNIPNIKSIYHTITSDKSLKKIRRRLIFGSPIINEKIGSFKFQISPQSFFQTNSAGAKVLYDVVKNFAEIEIGDTIYDLYCGTGTIGIYLSTLAKKIFGVEIVERAVIDAISNAKINKVGNTEFIAADSADYVRKNLKKLENTIIIVDPPRAGLKGDIIENISKAKFKKLVYVSCNPSTFVRDLKLFNDENIICKKIQPVDMFPQTKHIEVVGLLEKR